MYFLTIILLVHKIKRMESSVKLVKNQLLRKIYKDHRALKQTLD